MKIKTNMQAGDVRTQHNETIVRERGLSVRTGVQAGGLSYNHNQTVVREHAG